MQYGEKQDIYNHVSKFSLNANLSNQGKIQITAKVNNSEEKPQKIMKVKTVSCQNIILREKSISKIWM